jgi:preprotein translocase subunit SecE
MAGETRRQRRDARRASGQQPARAGAPRPVPAGPEQVAHVEHARRGAFVRESVAELRKVEWPNRSQVIQGTIVVLIACAIVGAFL